MRKRKLMNHSESVKSLCYIHSKFRSAVVAMGNLMFPFRNTSFHPIIVTHYPQCFMSIEKIVQQALEDGHLTPTMEAEVGHICDNASELSIEEYMALDRLMGALLTGEVVAVPRKQFINVMEELVLTTVIAKVAEIEVTSESSLDVGDITAYALNRLPPLYATTEEGAKYQREKAKTELDGLICQQVSEAISKYLDRPNFFPERQALNKNIGPEVLTQVTTLLQTHASNFEGK